MGKKDKEKVEKPEAKEREEQEKAVEVEENVAEDGVDPEAPEEEAATPEPVEAEEETAPEGSKEEDTAERARGSMPRFSARLIPAGGTKLGMPGPITLVFNQVLEVVEDEDGAHKGVVPVHFLPPKGRLMRRNEADFGEPFEGEDKVERFNPEKDTEVCRWGPDIGVGQTYDIDRPGVYRVLVLLT